MHTLRDIDGTTCLLWYDEAFITNSAQIMTELDTLIQAAITHEGKKEFSGKVYLALLRSHLYVPIQKSLPGDDVAVTVENMKPLFAKIDDNYFMLAFDEEAKLNHWAADQRDGMSSMVLSGFDLINGINEKVYLILNLGNVIYKEFSPDEILELKKIAARIEKLKQ